MPVRNVNKLFNDALRSLNEAFASAHMVRFTDLSPPPSPAPPPTLFFVRKLDDLYWELYDNTGQMCRLNLADAFLIQRGTIGMRHEAPWLLQLRYQDSEKSGTKMALEFLAFPPIPPTLSSFLPES